jgi:hypothetical protein
MKHLEIEIRQGDVLYRIAYSTDLPLSKLAALSRNLDCQTGLIHSLRESHSRLQGLLEQLAQAVVQLQNLRS